MRFAYVRFFSFFKRKRLRTARGYTKNASSKHSKPANGGFYTPSAGTRPLNEGCPTDPSIHMESRNHVPGRETQGCVSHSFQGWIHSGTKHNSELPPHPNATRILGDTELRPDADPIDAKARSSSSRIE